MADNVTPISPTDLLKVEPVRVKTAAIILAHAEEALSLIPDDGDDVRALVLTIARLAKDDAMAERKTTGLTLIEAIAFNRPFRRPSWVKRGPALNTNDETISRLMMDHWWIYPVVLLDAEGQHVPIFLNLALGKRTNIAREEMLAQDFEVMP